ncbi:MAG: TIGR01459 family HAD-type hydrolase [Rhizobiales bacterium]|nr:TIGR01459 family HAD-type hydrolase [Hyphomicrobiales bacterium]OJY44800.1 MAG: HAD family hydrolase [Rhizobiales bacterium 64-17]
MTVSLDSRLSVLAGRYDALLCDVWGVIHNGVAAFPDAVKALSHYRAGGGRVILITNAPRANADVYTQLDRLNVPRTAYDTIVTSGDLTRGAIRARAGQSVFHLGPERDRSVFAGIDVRFAGVDDADFIVCTGLFNDDTETPENYRDMLGRARSRSLFMACANPDVIVEKGGRIIYCAGALADLYRDLGGDVLYAGKPYAPIYEAAFAAAEKFAGAPVARSRMLAIGDSVRTDFTGARNLGLDFLFVTSGIHAEELGARDAPDATMLAKMFAGVGALPMAATARLRW